MDGTSMQTIHLRTPGESCMNRLFPRVQASARPARIKNESPAKTPIFGLRYLEDEAAEIHDVVGCLRAVGTCTECDDEDAYA
jgi:hypothetical protein